MSVILKQSLTKTDQQDWSGVFINISESKTPTPDPRDENNLSANTKIVLKEQKSLVSSAVGYEGWDRNYVTDNNLVVSYYFDTADNAMAYFTKRKTRIANTINSKVSIKYNVEWSIVDGDNITLLKPVSNNQ